MKGKTIIDSHIHITSPEIIENVDKYREYEPYFDLLCSSPKNKLVTADELVTGMDKMALRKAVVFGFGFSKMEHCREANSYTIEAVRKYPKKLIGFATVNPTMAGLEEELERCLSAGLRGVGEIMAEGQNSDITSMDEMSTLCEFCGRNDWPVLVHLNESVGHYYPGKTSDSIMRGAVLAENFPDTNFIFGHLGGGLCFYETMPEMRKALVNVYYDTAAVPFLYDNKIYDVLKAVGVIDKILFGSDYPLLAPGAYADAIEGSSLSGVEKEKIYKSNISKIFQ